MVDGTSNASSSADAVLFRPSKKKKTYRKRTDGENEDTITPLAAPAPSTIDDLISQTQDAHDLEAATVPMSEILRLRKLRKTKGGVEFRAASTKKNDNDELVLRDDETEDERPEDTAAKAVRRFAPQTGTVGDVNKHMMEYIDSELAKRRLEGQSSSQNASTNEQTTVSSHTRTEDKEKKVLDRQPATVGKLMEIDLGNEARERNAKMTEMARRRAAGEHIVEESGPPKKVRLGPDGKPWRGKKRRTSEDIKRDKLVEAVFRENRLEIYEEPVVPEPSNDEDADQRVAEQFRREFMDAMSAKQRVKQVAAPATRGPGGRKEEEVKGPKLGGSRSARAAMREMQLKGAKPST